MARTDQTYGGRRDDSASITRIVLTLLGVVVVVGLVGWAVVAFAGALVGPDTTATVEVPIIKPAVQPPKPAVVTTSAAVPSSAMTATPPAKKPKPKAPAPSPAPVASAKSDQFVVVIDPGHQGKGSNKPEPIGPGSSTTKPSVTSGATGSVTKRPESLVNLEVSLKIQKALEARGVKVIMVRTSQNVNISNSERAAIANKAGADLLLRIHCDDVSSGSLNGLLTMVPAKNKWTGPIVAPSAKCRQGDSCRCAQVHRCSRPGHRLDGRHGRIQLEQGALGDRRDGPDVQRKRGPVAFQRVLPEQARDRHQ